MQVNQNAQKVLFVVLSTFLSVTVLFSIGNSGVAR